MSKDYASMFLGSIEGFAMLCSGNNMYKISDVTISYIDGEKKIMVCLV